MKGTYTFRDGSLLRQALTHPSYSHEHGGSPNYQRLELLGDSILGMVIMEILYRTFPDAQESHLSIMQAALVNADAFAEVSETLELFEQANFGRSTFKKTPKIQCDLFEALIGAIFLDGGYEVTRRIIRDIFIPIVRAKGRTLGKPDPKTALQDWAQQTYHVSPAYMTTDASGPAHDLTFSVSVFLEGKLLASGIGKSKKEAEKSAAAAALEILT